MKASIEAFKSELLARLGAAPDVIAPGKLQRFSTNGKRGDTSGWCKFFEDGCAGAFGDWRSGVFETWTFAQGAALTREQRARLARQVEAATTERLRLRDAEWAKTAGRIEHIWAQCAPLIPGDPVTLYLKRRGFAGVWPLSQTLRLHQSLPYWDGDTRLGDFPAMVAPMVSPCGRVVALHRTYLTKDGRKADVPTVKKLTATAGTLAGACIPLFRPATGVLGVAEGIETALAAWCISQVPTVSAYSAGSLATWQWPLAVRHVVIFADNDPRGRDAAEHLRTRVLASGLACDVHAPSDEGADWCDVWATRSLIEKVGA